ncbi:type II CRISPR RNA-guided endonuclease Cas9 [Thiomicrorhabdus sp. 6S2-11]|uniref:CRISPR-associated endonuclease Cas9 n=1 Tax=Thiomicrorhabdus marina TaxID=2818442 RepID=A0ABS3Q6X8_9GAMM|nr:type II CRISPR RNA-guided endonuclease Cas9 [Thiomicrorhabdus marina]MBO1927833.1 type II CRISPR RNA-guided endonuclease Cas9 [Thiomicrorhabdus marina]
MTNNTILGLDLGTNSIGWALYHADIDSQITGFIDSGVRIFPMSVEDKTKNSKNAARRSKRLARRVIQRRAKRKQRMLNFLMSLDFLPQTLINELQPEIILNDLGDPYALRAKALDHPLTSHQLGRVLLHLVQRRGFQSNRKTLFGDMIDDPDLMEVVSQEAEVEALDKEEGDYLQSIAELRQQIEQSGARSLGEYLSQIPNQEPKRNRDHLNTPLRTDRQMYKDEFWQIINTQKIHHPILEAQAEALYKIIFFQRPLKLQSDRVGKCSLEPNSKRARCAWRDYQEFRYLQDINNFQTFNSYEGEWRKLRDDEREKLVELFENNAHPTLTQIKKTLGLSRNDKFNYDRADNKKFKGNLTKIEIESAFPEWRTLSSEQQSQLEEDVITFNSKKALKKRLINHWNLTPEQAVKLALVEFEPEHSDLSLKAIRKLLPCLRQGMMYSEARQKAGYSYKPEEKQIFETLPIAPTLANPIVNRALSELRRVVNAIIKQHGKPTSIRLEMARDLEMNTKRYKAFNKQQADNTKQNDEASQQFQAIREKNAHLGLSKYPSRDDKIRYRLWLEQGKVCAYSQKPISQTQLFSAETEVDHIVPYSKSLNDSYMNKVICFAHQNQFKGQRTPIEAFAQNPEQWEQIEQFVAKHYDKRLLSKQQAFYKKSDDDVSEMINSQLNDTRYISREALHYLKLLGSDVTTVKGQITAWLRHIWGLNRLLNKDDSTDKNRADHRHHLIDATVIACIDRRFYNTLIKLAKELERTPGKLRVKDLHFEPVFEEFVEKLQSQLDRVIVSHTPQRKLSGALHEDTGLGFREGLGTISRLNVSSLKSELSKKLTKTTNNEAKQKVLDKALNAIIDDSVREQVAQFLLSESDQPWPLHKDGKTPIKRVRVVKSKTVTKLAKLTDEKVGIRNLAGEIFKWHSYGNTHCLLVIQPQDKEAFAHQITVYEAAQKLSKGQNLMEGYDIPENARHFFLYKNDTVQLMINDQSKLFLVTKFGQLSQGKQPRPNIQPLNNGLPIKDEDISDSIKNLVNKYQIQPIKVNAIGQKME